MSRVVAPQRRGRNGHTADCPYWKRRPAGCPVCAGERKGPREQPAEPVAVAGPGTRITSCPKCFAPVDGGEHVCRY